jgi:hypothetical protein
MRVQSVGWGNSSLPIVGKVKSMDGSRRGGGGEERRGCRGEQVEGIRRQRQKEPI